MNKKIKDKPNTKFKGVMENQLISIVINFLNLGVVNVFCTENGVFLMQNKGFAKPEVLHASIEA